MNLRRLAIGLTLAGVALTQWLIASSLVFPGPRLTLAELWLESSFVGLVDVTAVERVDNESRVTLSLKEALKAGDNADKKLIVYIVHGGCPYPFPFEEGQQLLVFLEFDTERKMFQPIGSAESAVELDSEAFSLYAKRLNELPAILSIEDQTESARELMKWYLKCAESAQIRGDAAWGISSLRQTKRATLTEEQSLKIAEILTSENPPGKNSASLFGEITSFPNKKVDRYLLESLQRCHERGWADVTRSAVESLPDRLGIKLEETTVKRLDEYWDLLSEVYYDFDEKPEEKEQSNDDAKLRLEILWGSLSHELYLQCKSAMDKSESR